MNLWNLFTKSKAKSIDSEFTPASAIDTEAISNFSYDDQPDLIALSNSGEKVLLLMDDIEEQFFLYEMDFKAIRKQYKREIKKEYSVMKAVGDDAGFKAKKFILNADRIDAAILDITLGMSIKLENGEYIDLDGVDIGLALRFKFPNCVIRFCSAHPLNRRNPDIHQFIDKWETATGTTMDDFYFSKNSDRAAYINEVLK